MADSILLPRCARCGLTLVEVYSSPPLTLRKPCHDNRQHQWSETIEVVPLLAAGGTGEREETPLRFMITVQSREATSYHQNVEPGEVTEKLRQIGLEWKIADWSHDQPVTITVEPASPSPVSPAGPKDER